MKRALRFAPLIRVSTEKQAQKGESLRTQTGQIKQYVKSLQGRIPDHCWGYIGQEHATPGQERKKLDCLLADSAKGLFDAVIVADASRWSRDNRNSKEGLEILRTNSIKFYVGTMELDLFNPDHCLILGMSAEIGEFQARTQSLKSITNRIARARRDYPACGKSPYGRVFDKATESWSIDPEKQAIVLQASERYLNGENIVNIAHSLGMDFSNLWKILNHRSGDTWIQRFRSVPQNIDETVETTIPRLLDETTIQAIHAQAEANRTYAHGGIKNRYLLSRMIFCAKCGHALSGQVSRGKRCYRPARELPGSNPCPFHKRVPADLIENAVLIHLISTLGDVERLEKAIRRATPDLDRLEKLAEQQGDLNKALKKVMVQKERVVELAMDNLLSDDEIRQRMGKLRVREASIKSRVLSISAELEGTPPPEKIKRLSKMAINIGRSVTSHRPEVIFEKPYEWKRNLIEHAFSGKDHKGQRYGVYMAETGDAEQPWTFEIRGTLETALLGLPLDDEYLMEAFRLEPDYQDVDKELKKIKSNFLSSVQNLSPHM